MTEKLISELKDIYPFAPCEAPEFDAFNVAGMDFTVKGWDAQGLGRVSLMAATGMGGAMTMTALIVNPVEIDAPLFNLDLIALPGKRMLYMELYDTLLTAPRNEAPFAAIRAEYADVMDIPGKPCWYDGIRYGASVTKCAVSGQEARLDELMARFGQEYADLLKDARPCDPAKKKVKADAYRDGLLEHGGPATDSFLKVWGKEKTGEFFQKVLFG